MRQYPLALPLAPHYRAEDFVVSPGNETALHWIQAWPGWPGNAMLLSGPAGSGKTHLAQIWSERAKAASLAPESLSSDCLPALDAPLVLEDIERIGDEAALFHLLNAARENATPLLLTLSSTAWPFTLPDLTSRLRALPAATLAAPEDTLLSAVLAKLFADRQLQVTAEVLVYLGARMERSFAAAQQLVARIDAAALAQQRAVTLPLVRGVLEGDAH
jgi:chromosomal replication initiation ATPase DnaA